MVWSAVGAEYRDLFAQVTGTKRATTTATATATASAAGLAAVGA